MSRFATGGAAMVLAYHVGQIAGWLIFRRMVPTAQGQSLSVALPAPASR